MDHALVLALAGVAVCIVAVIVLAVINAKRSKQHAALQQRNDELSSRVGELGHELADADEALWRAKADVEKTAAQAKADAEKTAAQLHDAMAMLERYRPIVDAELRAAEIERGAQEDASRKQQEADIALENARKTLFAAQTQADTLVTSAQSKAHELVTSAQSKASALVNNAQAKAGNLVNSAQSKAGGILDEARTKATEIAADALSVRDKAEEYQRVAQALKNVIDGYGDEYIIPSSSVLDDLAEDYGFTESGEKLKEARATTRAMIKQGLAATCDYVEDIRRKTAVAFVIDAFNGKVDSILSKTKADNVGTLRQQILDAFALVNKNGQAFRSARITKEYLDARLEELHWGAVAMELRRLEIEEQRAIKERIRDEERARKEYERAIKEAARDEAKIQAALEKARAEMASASENQRTKYEQQLEELSERLREAEARSQRALSMAQQTRSGHVYVISNVGSFGGDVFKIGMTRRLEPLDRVRELGDASVPFPFDVHAMMYSADAPTLETSLHKKFNELRVNKVNSRKEFFRLGLAEIKSAAEALDTKAHFTMLAQAAEYRETMAIEKLPHEELEMRLQVLMNQELATEGRDHEEGE